MSIRSPSKTWGRGTPLVPVFSFRSVVVCASGAPTAGGAKPPPNPARASAPAGPAVGAEAAAHAPRTTAASAREPARTRDLRVISITLSTARLAQADDGGTERFP